MFKALQAIKRSPSDCRRNGTITQDGLASSTNSFNCSPFVHTAMHWSPQPDLETLPVSQPIFTLFSEAFSSMILWGSEKIKRAVSGPLCLSALHCSHAIVVRKVLDIASSHDSRWSMSRRFPQLLVTKTYLGVLSFLCP